MGPDRAVLVRKRIESGTVRRQSSNAPTTPHIGLQQAGDDAVSPLPTKDSAPQQVSGVRHHCPHLLLGAIERVGIESRLFAPEEFLELLLQRRGFPAQS